ncbi:type II secretion system protein [Kiritimatiellaeota bacterium B1221]|nr:type II secretion system protein [Kiritimatiellaeota bacterium B1221]
MKTRPASHTVSPKVCSGFTLIEMLVVVAIIALLASMMMPAISKALQKAKVTACQNNLHQIFVGYLAYMSDHQGNTWTENAASGYQVIKKGGQYVATGKLIEGGYIETDKVFDCPASPGIKGNQEYSPGGSFSDYYHRVSNLFYGPLDLSYGPNTAIECDDPNIDEVPWSHSRPWHADGYNILFLDGAVYFVDVIPWSSGTVTAHSWWREVADKVRAP